MDDFIPLAALLRAATSVPPNALVPNQLPVSATESATAALPPRPGVAGDVVDFVHADIVHELALMRLAAIESFEHAKDLLLENLAAEVLRRELALAPVDLETLARATLARFSELEPVTLVVSAADASRISAPLPMRIDPALTAGDFAVEVREGSLESTFAFRLQSALERAKRGAA